MNSKKLSERLSLVASFVPKGSTVADIGSDHAYLPCYLIHNQIAQFAIAGEVVKGPYESACREVQNEQLTDYVSVRFANGLEAIQVEDAINVVTIAGMGGPLIASILEKGKEKLETVERLILQPNIHAKAIREWAVQNEWIIIDEDIIKEDGKIYEVLVLEKGKSKYSEIELLLGPKLLKKPNSVFNEKWHKEVTQWEHIVHSIEQSSSTENVERKTSLIALIQRVKGVLENENR